jgi:hypothetical protein
MTVNEAKSIADELMRLVLGRGTVLWWISSPKLPSWGVMMIVCHKWYQSKALSLLFSY